MTIKVLIRIRDELGVRDASRTVVKAETEERGVVQCINGVVRDLFGAEYGRVMKELADGSPEDGG